MHPFIAHSGAESETVFKSHILVIFFLPPITPNKNTKKISVLQYYNSRILQIVFRICSRNLNPMTELFDIRYSWFHMPSVLFRISIRTQVTCTYITWLSQPIGIRSITTRPSSHVLEASIKTPKEILFCKQTGLYILHTKWGLVVRGHLKPLCMFIVTSKTNFMFFKQHPWLFTGWWRQDLVRHITGVLTESVYM